MVKLFAFDKSSITAVSFGIQIGGVNKKILKETRLNI